MDRKRKDYHKAKAIARTRERAEERGVPLYVVYDCRYDDQVPEWLSCVTEGQLEFWYSDVAPEHIYGPF